MSFWTDAAILGRAGIPSVLFGPGGAGLHSIEEYVDDRGRVACRDALATLALTVSDAGHDRPETACDGGYARGSCLGAAEAAQSERSRCSGSLAQHQPLRHSRCRRASPS